ncbi:hypothetical protein AB0F17_42825 [Nonomuraea sp. NPDC026600]|uniref:hypothetical protein n=1 Tax=Nonomuraea sp. NPDC026600 TaxID=3155363 RepID=UPI0033DD3731
MTNQRTWTIGGVTYTADLEAKARRLRNAFDPEQPRDRKGRWIETGASVSIWGGGTGTVARNLGGGRLEVHTADGRKLAIHRNYLTVTAAPGGKKPSGNPADRPRPQRAAKPSKDVQEFTPSGQDTRVPVSELRPGQLAYVHGWDQFGDSTSNLGRISGVSPAGPPEDADTKPGSGWSVSFVDNVNRHWTMFTTDDAVARVVPDEDFARLVEAERLNEQEQADRIAREIRDKVNAIDEAEASAQPEAPSPAEGGEERPELRARQWISTQAFNDPVRVEQIQDTLTGVEVEVVTIRGDRRTLAEEELGDWQPADEPPNHRADGAPVSPQTRPQEGLFADMGTDKDGNRDIFMAADDEDDQPAPAAAQPDELAPGDAPDEPETDELTPRAGVFDDAASEQITAAAAAYQEALAGDDEMAMLRAWSEFRDLVDERGRTGGVNSPQYEEGDRLTRVGVSLRDDWDEAHREVIRENRRRVDRILKARDRAEKRADEGDLDGGLAIIDEIATEYPDGENWDRVRALVRDKWVDPSPLPSIDDGTPPSPEGMSDARRAVLVNAIERMATGYRWTGDPGRYIAEAHGEHRYKGEAGQSEKDWIDAYIAAHPEVLTFTDKEIVRRTRQQERERENRKKEATARSGQAKQAFDAGDFDQALKLIDQAEELDPTQERWDNIRRIIREGQAEAGQPTAAQDGTAEPTPDPTAEPESDQDAEASAPALSAPETQPDEAQDDSPAREGDESELGARHRQRRQESEQRAVARDQAAQERAEGDHAVRERAASRQQMTALARQAREAYNAGDVEETSRLLDEAEQLAPGNPRLGMIRRVIREAQPAEEPPRKTTPEGQAYADEIRVGDTLSEAHWRMTGPSAGALRQGASSYANPAGPARLGEPERDSRRVTDIQEEAGGRLTFVFDDGARISRRRDALVTRGTPAETHGGEDIPQANAQTGDRIRFDTAGPTLPAALDREALGIARFEKVTVAGRISRRQPGMPSVALDDVTITRADGTTVPAPSGTRFSIPRRVVRLDDSEPAPAPEQVPGAGLREGDRISSPTGDVAVERVEQFDDGLVSALVRGDDDRRERHLIAADRAVRLAPTQDGDQVDEDEASGLALGEWVLIDDVPVQVASVPEMDGGRARFDVRDQDGRLSEMELDERLLLTRITGTPTREPEAPAVPPAEPERVTAVDLPDGIPTGRVRLRTDQRRRLLDLNLDATSSGASPEVAQAVARLRARRELSAEQMQALAAHLRTMAADENTPAPRQRALARTAGWVEAANARLEGFPPPPHDPGRPGPERAYARNLGMGDVIALPGEDGTVRFGTVTATRPVKGFGLHQVHVRHEDGSVEQRVLPDGVDLWLMPDLPADQPLRPADFTREHVTADRIDVGDTIRWDGTDFADPVVGQVLSVKRRGGEFAETRLYEMTVLDGDDEQRTITVADRGWPSVERLDRGPATTGQPYDSVMAPENAEYVGWRDLRVGDRAQVMMATGTITGITRHPAADDVPEGVTVQIMADSGEHRSVSVFDDPDAPDDYIDPSVMRLIPADDNAAARIAAVRREREQISREREFTAFLADLETTRSRWAATDVAEALRELPAGAGREEALAAALDRLDRIDATTDSTAATLAFRLGARDDAQTAAMASATSAVTGAVKARATGRIRAALEGADPLGSETWPRALARVAAAYRDHPPAPGVLPAGMSLARLRDRIKGAPEQPTPRMPDMPPDADLPGRLAAYRAQLPDDLTNLGQQPVMRTLFEPTTLEDLEAGRVPAVRQDMLWAPDIADDDGPGPEAMRQLAVLRTAGADLDVRFRQHLAGRADALGAELDAVTRERGQAWKAADDLDAEIARVRSDGGIPDEGLLGQRDDAAARWEAAAVREQELRRMLAEARREALAATLAEVRQVGGDGLDYIDRNRRVLTARAGSNAGALRYVEEVLPSDWLAAARESGPVEVVTGPGQHVHVRADGSTRISLPTDDHTQIAPAIREGQPGRVPVPSAQPGGVAKATVAAHELGHHLEATVPGLRAAGQAMLWDRTSHGDVGDRVRPEPISGEDRGRPFEIYPGDFPDARTGRVNGDGTQEVFANVLESLAGHGDYADDDLRHWGLGVLALLATDATGPQGGTRREERAERRDPLDGINLLALTDEQLRALLARIDDPRAVARLRGLLDEREQHRTGGGEIDLTDVSDAELESMLLAGWDGYGDDPAKTALQDRVIAETEAREAERGRRGDELGDLAASELLSMDTDDLATLYGRNLGRYGLDPAVTSLLDQISAELEERDRRRDIGSDPYAGLDLAGMSEEQLAELIERHQPLYHSDPWSGALVRRVIAELDDRDRQQGAEDDRTPEETRMDELIGQGWNPREAYAEVYGLSEEEMDRQERIAIIDAERGAGERREQVVRRMYKQWVYEQALDAEKATNGYMLSPLGRKAGVNPERLWGGNADHAYAYASEELKRWWADQPNGGRMTYDEWRAQWLGDSRDRRQAQERRQTAGNGKDFG